MALIELKGDCEYFAALKENFSDYREVRCTQELTHYQLAALGPPRNLYLLSKEDFAHLKFIPEGAYVAEFACLGEFVRYVHQLRCTALCGPERKLVDNTGIYPACYGIKFCALYKGKLCNACDYVHGTPSNFASGLGALYCSDCEQHFNPNILYK